jgi:Tfp pilus assembly protein PilZ
MNGNRKHVRHSYSTEVELLIDENTSETGTSLNISTGGIFIDNDTPLADGSKISIIMTIPGIPEPCTIPCIVRWFKKGDGLGLQFESLRAIEVWALNKLIRGLSD